MSDSSIIAKMASKGEHKMCSGCAFRKGTKANKDFAGAAVNALFWEHDFRCHMQDRKCGGFLNAIHT